MHRHIKRLTSNTATDSLVKSSKGASPIMSTLPLSIFLITKNEEKRLPATLEACKGLTDDLIVIDSGSTDRTLDIAKEYGAKIHHRDWEGYGQQKVYGESLCRHKWILNIDADEIIQDDLRQELIGLFKNSEELEKGPAAYSLNIVYVGHLSVHKKPRFLAPVNVTPRLYNKMRAGFKDSAVHDKVVIYDGTAPMTLSGKVSHISFTSFSHMWTKILEYAELQADDWVAKGRNPHWTKVIWDPLAFFFKHYFLRRMCFVGWEGFVYSLFLSTGRALRIVLTMEKIAQKTRQKLVEKPKESNKLNK